MIFILCLTGKLWCKDYEIKSDNPNYFKTIVIAVIKVSEQCLKWHFVDI